MLSATAIRGGQPLQHQRRAQTGTSGTAAGRRCAVQTQALFSFLSPKTVKASAPSKAKELVTELLEISERTDGGLNASPAKRQQIAELVGELEGYCPRNPLRSPLLFGDYEVLYASKPQTAGGPYRSLPGRVVFSGQRALQSLQEPNILVNELSYKALGLIPGSARQVGEFRPINGNTFELTFPGQDSKRGAQARIIKIAYLDDRIRVARFVPPEGSEEAEPSFYVFRRLGGEEEQEEEAYAQPEEEEEEAPAKRGGFGMFGTRKVKAAAQEEDEEEEEKPKRGGFGMFGTRKVKAAAAEEEEEGPTARRGGFGTQMLGRRDGLATMAEKRYAQQQGGTRGTGGTTATRGTSSTSGTARKSREELAAERAAAKAIADEDRRAARQAAEEEKAAAREAAIAAKAAAEEERRARQQQLEEQRARVAELKDAAREQMAELQGEVAEATSDAKAAAAAAKDAEKAASSLLQQASQARGLIDRAASAAAAALEQLEGYKQAEKEAAASVGEARNVVKQLEGSRRRR